MRPDERFDSLIAYYAEAYDRDPRQVKRQIEVESSFNPEAVSTAGCVGLGQFGAAAWKDHGRGDLSQRTDPERSIAASCSYMAALEARFGSLDRALAAYNAGPRRVEEALTLHDDWLAALPGETRVYVKRCMSFAGETIEGR